MRDWLKLKLDRVENGLSLVPFGVRFLDDTVRGLSATDLCVVGAWTGVGKTEFVADLAVRASTSGKRVLFFSLESESGEIENRLLFRAVARRFFAQRYLYPQVERLTYVDFRLGEYEHSLKDLIAESEKEASQLLMNCDVYYRSGSFTVKDFVGTIEARRSEVDLIICDHLHYFDSLGLRNEIEELSTAMSTIRDACLLHRKPVVLVSHLRKKERNTKQTLPDLDDFHGTSNISKIATIAITIAQDNSYKLGDDITPTIMHVAKFRHDGSVRGHAGLLSFNHKIREYSDDYYVLKVSKFDVEPGPIAEKSELPHWASGARLWGGV